MSDVHNKATRSYNMSRIRGKDTKPEIRVRKFLHTSGFRFRLHVKDLTGKPDIVLPKYKTAIFVNGCFWHGHHNCKKFSLPKTNSMWWQNKISKNIANDSKSISDLQNSGWNVITIWECEIKENKFKECLDKLLKSKALSNLKSSQQEIG